jgi:hypothetical protein
MSKTDHVDDITTISNPEEFVRKKHGGPVRNVRLFVQIPMASSLIDDAFIRSMSKTGPGTLVFLKAMYGQLHGTGWPLPVVKENDASGTSLSRNDGNFPAVIDVTISRDGDTRFSVEARGKSSHVSGHAPVEKAAILVATFVKMVAGWYRP